MLNFEFDLPNFNLTLPRTLSSPPLSDDLQNLCSDRLLRETCNVHTISAQQTGVSAECDLRCRPARL